MTIEAAARYNPVDDLAIVTCYFNPSGFVTIRQHYEVFARSIQASGLKLVTVECGMGQGTFELGARDDVIKVRTKSVLWQKERLLNIALERLHARITKVCWLDADLLFANAAWAVETSEALERWPVVQPFSTSIRLPPRTRRYDGKGLVQESFCARLARSPNACTTVDWQRHGEPGLGWAARREVLADGLYDRAIGGGGDHLMAHAFAGDWESECVRVIMPPNAPYEADYRAWCATVYPRVRGRLGFVEGNVLHLWHGSRASRRYRDRTYDLAALEYNPSKDIGLGPTRCWEWTGRNQALERWCRRYFEGRKANRPSAQASISRRDIVQRIRRYRDRAENAQLKFWADAATSAERAVLRASTITEVRDVANDFFDWCTDEAEI